jgi:hypothetical protein
LIPHHEEEVQPPLATGVRSWDLERIGSLFRDNAKPDRIVFPAQQVHVHGTAVVAAAENPDWRWHRLGVPRRDPAGGEQ